MTNVPEIAYVTASSPALTRRLGNDSNHCSKDLEPAGLRGQSGDSEGGEETVREN